MNSKQPIKPRRYEEDVDFDELALQDDAFAKVYEAGSNRVDFQDPKALQQLTKSLLKRDFAVSIELPDDRLCPPVPVRYNYIAWLQSLLDTTNPTLPPHHDKPDPITGLDIGTGASAIYPLIACSQLESWHMHGTDIDPHSLIHARRNIGFNPSLASRIHIHESTPDGPLIPLDLLQTSRLDFVMCNPPFYSSASDMAASASSKTTAPSAVCTGSESEMICPGGDLGFATRITEESLVLRDKVRWYTCMLGKLSSVHGVVARLKQEGVSNFAVASLRAGRKTRRWAVGWSFGGWRPANGVARWGELVQAVLPLPTEQSVDGCGIGRERLTSFLSELMEGLDLIWRFVEDEGAGIGIARENVWSRSARRKRKRGEVQDDQEASDHRHKPAVSSRGDLRGSNEQGTDADDGETPALTVKISITETGLEIRWLRGQDYTIFESFCGMIKRAVRQEAQVSGAS